MGVYVYGSRCGHWRGYMYVCAANRVMQTVQVPDHVNTCSKLQERKHALYASCHI